jgi:hypothetical protein
VVATQWRIGDRSTVDFVHRFYGAMAEGRSVGDALQAAKIASLRAGAPAREWAAFTVIGDPLLSVPFHAPRSATPRWLLGAGTVLVLLAGYGAARRRRPRPELP